MSKKMIRYRDIKRLMLEGRIKIRDRIGPIAMRKHPEFVCEVQEEMITVLSPSGDIDFPKNIHKREYPLDSHQGYAEIYWPGGREYDEALRQLNEIRGDYQRKSVEGGITK